MTNGTGWGRILRVFAIASTISVQFALSVVFGWWLGHRLDQIFKLETPWLGLIGLLIGIGAGVYGIVRLMNQLSWKNQNK